MRTLNETLTHASVCRQLKAGQRPAPSAATLWHKSNNAFHRRERSAYRQRRAHRRRGRSANSTTGFTPASAASQRRRRFQIPQTTVPNSRYPSNLVTCRFSAASPAAHRRHHVNRRRGRSPCDAGGFISPSNASRNRRRFISAIRLAITDVSGSISARNGNPQTRTAPFAPHIVSRSRRQFRSRNPPETPNPGSPSVPEFVCRGERRLANSTRRHEPTVAFGSRTFNETATHADACCRLKAG